MNVIQVLRVVSVLLLVVAFFMLVPLAIGLYRGEDTAFSFTAPVLLILVLSSPVLAATRKKAASFLSTRDGFLLVTLSWLSSAFFSSLPFYLSGAVPRFVDCFFEAMSGYTTTGASILTDIESLPASILFWRSLTHWLGGMGIVVLTVAILPLLGIGGLQLIRAEAPGPTMDKITPKVTATAKILWFIYLGFTAAETLLLAAGGMSLFDAFTHTFGTLATGGFSPRNLSVGHYDSPFIHVVITVFMLAAGTNFIIYFKLLTGRFRSVFTDTELKVYLGTFAVAAAGIALSLWGRVYADFGTSLRYAGFQAATILTTTGYVTADYTRWPRAAQAILFLLMFIGGSAGSTGGGVKVIRIVTLFKQGWSELKKLIYPRGMFTVRLSGSAVSQEVVYAISGFVFLYLFILLVTTLVVASGGNDILTSLATSLVTLGNIGPGFGKIGPSGNYAFYPDHIKWFLSFIMMTGRLEIYTVVVLLTPTFWKR
ncbi:MAG: TrkH family potassium uptake protein [Spirochaetota bacterium]